MSPRRRKVGCRPGVRSRSVRLRIVIALVALSGVLSACGSAHNEVRPTPSRYPLSLIPTTAPAAKYAAPGYQPAPPSSSASSVAAPTPVREPIAGHGLWVDPNLPAAAQVATWRAQGDNADAAILDRIAAEPMAVWFTSDAPATFTQLSQVTHAAEAAGQLPTLVLYYMVGRDCSGYSLGGAPNDDAYDAWIRSIAETIGTTHAIVILEPDAIADVIQGCAARQADERFALLRYAVTVLEQHLGVSVYLDAGSPGFPADQVELAAALKQSDIGAAQGFALNVSNFYLPGTLAAYGEKLSHALGGAHFVIDTSRDGAGPLPPKSGYGGPSWCNPPGRRLGLAPTTTTQQPALDAYLWIKTPGASDGTCGLGDPPAGKWWLPYAMSLAGS